MNKKNVIIMAIAVLLIFGIGIVAMGSNGNKTNNEPSQNQTENSSATSEEESGSVDVESEASEVIDSETSTEIVDTEDSQTEIVTESESSEATEIQPSEESSEKPSEESSESEEGEPSESEKPNEGPSESEKEEQAKPTYTYTELNTNMWAKNSVNVRSLPNSDGEKLGKLSAGVEVKVTGKCNETGWYRIEYKGGVGYVSGSYLTATDPNAKKEETTSEKVEDTKKPEETKKDEGEQAQEGLSEGTKLAIEAGYYKVVADPAGGYQIIVKNDSREEKEKGWQILDEYLDALGYESKGYYGHWVDRGNNQYIIHCKEVQEKFVLEEQGSDFWD